MLQGVTFGVPDGWGFDCICLAHGFMRKSESGSPFSHYFGEKKRHLFCCCMLFRVRCQRSFVLLNFLVLFIIPAYAISSVTALVVFVTVLPLA